MVRESKRRPEAAARVVPAARGFMLPGGEVGILLIHGFAGSIAYLRNLGEFLHGQGYSVIGVRLAGHGATAAELHQSTATDWVASVRSAVAQFPPTVSRIMAVGESMGAFIAAQLSRENPRIRGLVLLAPPLVLRGGGARKLMTKFLDPELRRPKPWINDQNRDWYIARGSLTEVTVGAYREFLRYVEQELVKLRETAVPVLAVFADGDYATDPRSADALRHALPGIQCSIVVLHERLHHLTQTASPQQLYQIIAEFIRRMQ